MQTDFRSPRSKASLELARDYNSRLLNTGRRPSVHGTVEFSSVQKLWVPTAGGVYLAHDLRGVLYIGRSRNLQRRFEQHVDAPSNELLRRARRSPFGTLSFSWVVERDAQLRAQLERDLVLWLQPACNRALPSLSYL